MDEENTIVLPPYVIPGAMVAIAARLLQQSLAQAQQHLGIAPAQFRILYQLWLEDGLTQKDLVERLNIEQSTMGNTLSRMERDGLIERKPHPYDGRAQLLCLTKRAQDLKDPAIENAKRVNESALSAFAEDEKEQFTALMQKLLKTLKEEI